MTVIFSSFHVDFLLGIDHFLMQQNKSNKLRLKMCQFVMLKCFGIICCRSSSKINVKQTVIALLACSLKLTFAHISCRLFLVSVSRFPLLNQIVTNFRVNCLCTQRVRFSFSFQSFTRFRLQFYDCFVYWFKSFALCRC